MSKMASKNDKAASASKLDAMVVRNAMTVACPTTASGSPDPGLWKNQAIAAAATATAADE